MSYLNRFIEPKTDRADYDQQVFLATHEFEPFVGRGTTMPGSGGQLVFWQNPTCLTHIVMYHKTVWSLP